MGANHPCAINPEPAETTTLMNQKTAIQHLDTLERRLRPAPPPWSRDPDVRTEWVTLVTHYNEDVAREAFKALETHHGTTSRWPNWIQLRDALNKARRRNLPTPAIEQGEPVPPSVGIAIAYAAYCDEREDAGLPVNELAFQRWVNR